MVSFLHGPAVFTAEEKYQKLTFDDIIKDKAKVRKDGRQRLAGNGAALLCVSLGAARQGQARILHAQGRWRQRRSGGCRRGLILPVAQVAPGASASQSITLYAGPQEQAVLKRLAEGLDLVVDYGWLDGRRGADLLGAAVDSCACRKLGLGDHPAHHRHQGDLLPAFRRQLQVDGQDAHHYPRLQQLKERFGDDRARLNQEMMKLYQTEKINPLGGCLPILVQIPVFIALYWVLLGAVEMRDARGRCGSRDLSSADPYYVLPVIMVVSMVIQTKLNPTPPDPIQAKVMMMMPFIFGVMFFWFPSGLVLYWVSGTTSFRLPSSGRSRG